MRVRVLQHVGFEGLGAMAPWLSARGADIAYTQFHRPDAILPEPRTCDLVIALGGPMGVNDEPHYPWLAAEKAFIRETIALGTPIVGICLGAQLIASALGARVYRNPVSEIGWFPIDALAVDTGAFRLPHRTTVFQWHGDTFDLPPGAVHLASSPACSNQAFQIGGHVIGMQFHLETTPETVDLLIRNCRDEITNGEYIQTESAMRAATEGAYRAANALMDDILSHLTRGTVRAAVEGPR